jgi:MFS family permease
VWLVASRLFCLTGGGILFAYAAAYLKFVFGYSQEQAGAAFLVMLAAVACGNAVAVVPAARISGRIGRKRVIYAACLFGAAGVAITALAPTLPIAIGGATLYGAASGTFLAVDWALMTDIIPRASAGRYMGLSNVATGSAPLFAAALGGVVLDSGTALAGPAAGPRAAFLLGVVLFGISALLLRPVVEPSRGKSSGAPEAPALPA